METVPAKPSLVKRLFTKTGLIISLGIVLSLGATGYILFFTGPNLSALKNFLQKKPTVTVKTEYQNPFAKETHYVNPFDTFKSPFYSLKTNKETKK